MADLRSTQFYIGTITGTGSSPSAFYTVPAGHRIIVKSIVMRNLGGSGQIFRVKVDNSVIVFTQVLGAGSTSSGSAEWSPWMVLNPGETIAAYVTDSTGVVIVVSGYLLYI